MPTKILHKERLIPGRTSKHVLDAPQIAASARPGHFVILRVDEKGERCPLTIADTDKEHGTITIVYLVLGRSTQMLEELEQCQLLHDDSAPLGRATNLQRNDAPKKAPRDAGRRAGGCAACEPEGKEALRGRSQH